MYVCVNNRQEISSPINNSYTPGNSTTEWNLVSIVREWCHQQYLSMCILLNFVYSIYLGIGYYPINTTNGYIYTSSSDGLITRYTAVLDKTARALNVTANSSVMNRAPSNVSLISVDWLNDMLYWLETVNDTYSVVSIVIVIIHICTVCIIVCVISKVYQRELLIFLYVVIMSTLRH